MKSYLARAAVSSAVATLALSTAWAVTNSGGNASPVGAHYRQGSSEPVCTVSGLTVSCTGTQIAGVGSTNATVRLSVSYSATVQCQNKGGQIVEVKTQTTTASSLALQPDARNGTLVVPALDSTAPSNQSFRDAATCPNGNWTKVLQEGSPAVTGFTYTLTFVGFTEPFISITG